MTRLLILLLPLLLGAVCAPVPPPAPPAPAPGPDAGRPAATCADWCRHAEQLGCLAAQPTFHGTPCSAVCDNVQGSRLIAWDLECRVRAPDCAVADRCERR